MESNKYQVADHPAVPRPRTTEAREPAREPAGEPAREPAWELLGILRTLRARERGYLAGVLHDGPIQELAAATLELTLAGPAAAAAEPRVQAAGRSLRRLMEELAPLAPLGPLAGADPGLAATLGRRTGWLLAAPLALDLGEGVAGLRAPEVEIVADLVELMLAGAVPAEAPARALAAVHADRELITVELHLSVTGDPSPWLRRLTAFLQVSGITELTGHRLRVRVELPRSLSVLM
jgi:hypothetical protein